MITDKKPQVVIVGGGFGGLWAAQVLAKQPVAVSLIDKHNYHTFLPLLYQVAAAELEPGQIGYPIRAILRRSPNVAFRLGEVIQVDVDEQQVVVVNNGRFDTIPYDYLILATGSVSRYFGIPGADKYAFSLKTMEEGIQLRNHILSCFEIAGYEQDQERRRALLTFAVVGGGPTGVEYAGALAELIYGPLAKDYPGLNLDEVQVTLLEAADSLLLAMPDKLGQYAVNQLQQMRVNVRLKAIVNEVAPDWVQLKDGTILATHTVVWTAGVGGEGMAEASGLATRPNGTVAVRPTLQLSEHDNVYVVGDLAAFKVDERYLPMVAPVATQQGTHAAENLLRQLRGEPLRPFQYRDNGSMSTIGRNAAVVHIKGKSLSGFIAWVVWLAVHLANLIGFRNRLVVLINWAWSYLFYERVVRLILPTQAKRHSDKN